MTELNRLSGPAERRVKLGDLPRSRLGLDVPTELSNFRLGQFAPQRLSSALKNHLNIGAFELNGLAKQCI